MIRRTEPSGRGDHAAKSRLSTGRNVICGSSVRCRPSRSHGGVRMRYGVVVEELAVEAMAQQPDDRARQEVRALVEVRG